MFYTYRNLEVLIDNRPIWVNSATFSVDNSLQANYLVGNRYTNDYSASQFQVGSLKLNYYVTGVDYLKSFLNNDTVNSVSGYFGGFYFPTGYIKSFSVQGEVNKPVMAAAELMFFQETSGSFVPSHKTAPKFAPLHFSDATISINNTNEINGLNNITSFNYSYSQEINPIANVDTIYPNVVLGKRDVSLTVDQFHIDNFIPFTGKSAALSINLKDPISKNTIDTISVIGKCIQKNIVAETNKPIFSTLNIIQNYLYFDPSISGFYPLTGGWGSGVMVSGENLNEAVKITFNDLDQNVITIIDNSTVSGNVPYNAISGPLKVLTLGGEVTAATHFKIIDSGFLSPLTGIKATGSYTTRFAILGKNISRLSRVLFFDGTITGFATGENLQQVSESIAYVSVPFDATAIEKTGECPWVISDVRNVSGQILNYRVIPQQTETLQKTGTYSGYLYITGQCLGTGANQALFVSSGGALIIKTGIPEYISRNYFRVRVPSGIVNSLISIKRTGEILWQQGFNTKLNLPKYSPTAWMSGNQPSGRTGAIFEWTGVGFYPEIMKPTEDGYSIDFGGITGKTKQSVMINAGDINNPYIYRYTGLVPTGINNLKTNVTVRIPTYTGNFHIASGFFYLITDPPTITRIIPQTGGTGSAFTFYGENLWNLDVLKVTGLNAAGTSITYPITGFTKNPDNSIGFVHSGYFSGKFSIVATNNGGVTTGYNTYRVKGEPQFTAFTLGTSSGIYGDTCFIAGYDIDSYDYATKVWVADKGHQMKVVNNQDNFGQTLVVQPQNYEYGFTGGYVIINNGIKEKTYTSTFRYIPLPIITGVSTTTGYWTEKSAYGTNIDLMGSGLNTLDSVYIDNPLYPSLITSKTESQASISIHPQSRSSKLKYDYVGFGFPGFAETATSSFFIRIIPPPLLISGFNPLAAKPQQNVLISGSGFDRITQVFVSGNNGQELQLNTFTFLNNQTQIRFAVPSDAISGFIRVRQLDANYDISVYSSPHLSILPIGLYSGFHPSTGIAGDRVIISGSGLSGISVLFDTYPSGFISGLNATYVADTGISFTVPREIHSLNVYSSGFGVFAQTYSNLFTNIPIISGVALTGYNTGQNITITGIGISNTSNIRFVITGKDGWEDLVDNAAVQTHYPTPWTAVNYTGYSVITGIVSKNFGGTGNLIALRGVSTPLTGGRDLPSGYYYYTHTGQNLSINPGAPFITGFSPLSGAYDMPITISGSGMKFVTGVYWVVGAAHQSGFILNKTDYTLTAVLNKNTYPFTFGRIKTVSPFGSDQINNPTWGHLGKTNYTSFTPRTGAISGAVVFTEDVLFAGIARSFSGITGVYFGNEMAQFAIGETSPGVPSLTGFVPDTTIALRPPVYITLRGYGGDFTGNSTSGGLFTFSESSKSFEGIVTVTGQFVLKPFITVPLNSGSAGDVGSFRYDDNYFYIKTADGTWKRGTISTF